MIIIYVLMFQCVVSYFDGKNGQAGVYAWLENNSLIISDNIKENSHELHIKVTIKY